MDYYKILGNISRSCDCNSKELKDSYRKMALKWHPSKHNDDDFSNDKFSNIHEAYMVLSNPKLRAIYDQYGENGLKNGISTNSNGTFDGWIFNDDPYDLFINFFGTNNPFDEIYNNKNSQLLNTKISEIGLKKPPKMPAIEKYLYISLDEFYYGCIKKKKIIRKRLSMDGNKIINEHKIMTIEIKKGWYGGIKLTYPDIGDEGDGYRPGDIIFILKQREHLTFTRKNHINLLYKASITLKEALCGTILNIKTLDQQILPISLTKIVQSGSIQIISNKGMPIIDKDNEYGDLEIHFTVNYPESLTITQKDALNKIL